MVFLTCMVYFRMRVIGSVILSTQIFPADEDDFQGASIGLTYNTLSVRNPISLYCSV